MPRWSASRAGLYALRDTDLTPDLAPDPDPDAGLPRDPRPDRALRPRAGRGRRDQGRASSSPSTPRGTASTSTSATSSTPSCWPSPAAERRHTTHPPATDNPPNPRSTACPSSPPPTAPRSSTRTGVPGQPVVFSHGWPLTSDVWDNQLKLVADHGFRGIAHDRRGGGRSSQTWDGNDLDTYADDLAAVMDTLDLHDAVLVGHSTGGRRGHPLPGPARHRPRVQGGAAERHPAADAADRGQPGGHAAGGVRRDPRRASPATGRSTTTTSPNPSTARTAPARASPRAPRTRSG